MQYVLVRGVLNIIAYLNAIYGAVALVVRADQLILLPAHVILQRNSHELLVLDVELEPVVAVHLEPGEGEQLQVEVLRAAVLLGAGLLRQ